jgi:hypothetical protein
MTEEFRQDYLVRLPLPLAQVYNRACDEEDPRGRHDNAFYLFEALVKLMAAPLVMAYLHEVDQGGQRVNGIDQRLEELARPALGHWMGMVRELARHFGTRAEAASHPLGHLWGQLTRRHRDQPGLLGLYQRIKNGPDGARASDQSCTVLQVLEALVQYRNAVLGHGGARYAAFYRRMSTSLLPAANEVLAEAILTPLGPPGTRLVYLTALQVVAAGTIEVGLRELVGMQGQRGTPMRVRWEEAHTLEPHCIAVLWPGQPLPLRLDPLLVYRQDGPVAEVLFLNENPDTRRVEYLSYTRGEPVRDTTMALAMARLLSRVTGRTITTEELAALAAPSHTETLATEAPEAPSATAPAAASPSAAVQVARLYKRQAQPDEEVLKFLEARLKAQGYKVFIDRHLTIGMEWATEIERQIRSADAIIPLLSAASVQSEMLAWEVNVAHDAAQQQDGKPRLLPVRLNYTEPLPEELARVLNRLEYALWESPRDNQRLVDQLLHALHNPAPLTPGIPRDRLEWPVGAVPMDSQFYLVRPTDEALHAAIARQDSIVLIKGARQMGKTSLLARGLHQARQLGRRVVLTDFQKLNTAHLDTLDTLYLALGGMIAEQLDLDVQPEDVWQARRGPNSNFERYMRREVLGTLEAPLVWGLDEVDRLFTYPFSGEVFGLLRAWHNERAFDATGPWCRLTLAIAYATEAYLFITDLNQSPFNVGTRLTLEDFTLEQVATLNRRYGSPLRTDAEVARFFHLLGGQPYLVRRGLHDMVMQELRLDALEAQADQDEGLFGDHLRRLLVLLAQNADLRRATHEVLQGRPCPDVQSFHRLRSAGVLTGDSLPTARPRCQLYAAYLRRHL